jgi:hypothetical protein
VLLSSWPELLVANPFNVFAEHDLLSAIVKFSGRAVGVVGDILRSLFLKKASESARTERVRRVTTNNPSLR